MALQRLRRLPYLPSLRRGINAAGQDESVQCRCQGQGLKGGERKTFMSACLKG